VGVIQKSESPSEVLRDAAARAMLRTS